MITDYILKKLKTAKYKTLGDGSYFASIPGLSGVWASAKTLKVCKEELREVLEDWVVVSLKTDRHVPGMTISFDKRHTIKNA